MSRSTDRRLAHANRYGLEDGTRVPLRLAGWAPRCDRFQIMVNAGLSRRGDVAQDRVDPLAEARHVGAHPRLVAHDRSAIDLEELPLRECAAEDVDQHAAELAGDDQRRPGVALLEVADE